MTPEQIWAAIVIVAVAVATQFIRLIGDTVNDLMRARTKKVASKIESEASDVQARTATEQMGIEYMHILKTDNDELRKENKQSAIDKAKLEEQVRLRDVSMKEVMTIREQQLATQSDLKVQAIKSLAMMEERALKAEALTISTQVSFNDCMTQTTKYVSDLAVLTGKYSELQADTEERREDWHRERDTWQVLDTARQTEVQRARFIMRYIENKLSEEQRSEVTQACAAKGFDYQRFVEVAGSLEMAELEDLRRKNIELEQKLAKVSPTPPSQVSS